MNRTTLAANALLAAAALCGCGQQKPPVRAPQADGPEPAADVDPIKLEVTVPSAKVALGEPISFHVKLTNGGRSAVVVTVPRLDRASTSFRVRRPDDTIARVERIFATQDPRTGRMIPDAPPVKSLDPGQSLEEDVSVLAVEAGKLAYTPIYQRRGAPGPLVGSPVEIEVSPADPAKPHLGIRLETTCGPYVARLRPDVAFNTCEAIASLVRGGFYDGLKFHRIIKGFMAQGGDPEGTGGGGPGFMLPLEAGSKLLHTRGVMSMARAQDPDSAGSQFFLMFAPNPGLDRQYTAFAEMVDGDGTLTKLADVPVDKVPGDPQASPPKEKILIQHASLVQVQ